MAKDYAKRYRQPAKKQKKAAASSGFKSLLVLLVIVLVIAAGLAGYYYHGRQPQVLEAVPDKKAVASAPILEAKEDPVDYEFYTVLPEMRVPTPVEGTRSPEQQAGFWLQLMVYYNMRDASAFVDRLQLAGLDPVITQRKSTKTDHDLFVVVLGPFTSKENALARQQDLKKINISSYIFHVDPAAVNQETAPLSQTSQVPVTDAEADA